jgi:hypothetical protein
MEQCKVCGQEFKVVNMVHVRTHNIDMTQYAMYPEYGQSPEPVEPKGNTKVTQEEMNKRIFGDQERDVNRPLVEFLNEFGLTEEEARQILKRFTTGKQIDPKVEAKNFQRVGSDGAQQYKNLDYAEVTNLHIAEELTVNYGFTCTNLIGAKGDKPKTWILERI